MHVFSLLIFIALGRLSKMNILYNLKFSISLKLSNSSLHGNALSPSLIKALTEFCKLNDPTLKQEHHLPRYKGLALLCILIANFLSSQAKCSFNFSQYSYIAENFNPGLLFYDSTILNIYGVSSITSCKILICFWGR